jgi:hypothetical protein
MPPPDFAYLGNIHRQNYGSGGLFYGVLERIQLGKKPFVDVFHLLSAKSSACYLPAEKV